MKVDTARGERGVLRSGTHDDVVVLLHPLALNATFWDPVATRLARSATVLALDARGHGESAWDGRPFTVEDLADDTAAVLDAADVAAATVVGMSMGGCTAIALAARHPSRVRGLVLADTTAWYGADGVEKWALRARQAVEVVRTEQLAFQVDRWFSAAFRRTAPAEVDRVSSIFVSTPSAVHAAACRALGAFDGRDALPTITAPTAVLVGEDDEATPPAMAAEIASGVPGCTMRVLERARHFGLLERKDLWSRL